MLKQDAYLSGLTLLIPRTEDSPVGSDGYLTNTTKYARRKEGYQGRVYAQGVAFSKVPRMIREIEYTGISAREWGVAMAYFTFDGQAVCKLKPILSFPHFQMDTLRLYIRDRRLFWNSMKERNE